MNKLKNEGFFFADESKLKSGHTLMKFKINKADILSVLSKVQGITGRKTNLAITANILIKSIESGVSVTATDLETGFEGHYPAEVESPGVITVNARKFYEIVNNFPSEEIVINEVERQWIRISCESVEFHIVGMSSHDFPEVSLVEDADFIEMDSADLKKMIERTVMIQAPSDEKRAHITGVSFNRFTGEGQNRVSMVSTDGKRLCKAEYQIAKDYDFSEGDKVIVPKKGLVEAAKMLGQEGVVRVGVKDNSFIVKKDNETVIVNLLEGEFPDIGGVTVKDDVFDIRLDKKSFLMMLKRMSILSTDSYNSVVFNLNDNNLMVTATNPDFGDSREDFPVDFSRDRIEVAFNPKYFIETLNAIGEETVVVNIKDNKTPCLIEGDEDKSFLSIIMPMKI